MNPLPRRSFVRSAFAAIAGLFSLNLFSKDAESQVIENTNNPKLGFYGLVEKIYSDKGDWPDGENPAPMPFYGLGVSFRNPGAEYPSHRAFTVIPLNAGPDEVAGALEELAALVRIRLTQYEHYATEANIGRYPVIKTAWTIERTIHVPGVIPSAIKMATRKRSITIPASIAAPIKLTV